MKNAFLLLTLISLSSFGQTRFELNATESKINWTASYIVGGGHEGTLKFVSGFLLVSSTDTINSGDFVIDMGSIKSTDETSGDLANHLKSNDFFSSKNFPHAFFSITKIQHDRTQFNATEFKSTKFTVTGTLNIKGVINQISFPATIVRDRGTMSIKAKTTIDRTKWGITYNSNSFFDDLKDGAISDDIEIAMNLVLMMKGC